MLLSLDRHFPAGVCDLHFSYDKADTAVQQAMVGLRQPVNIIRRGHSMEWSGAMQHDLDQLTQYRWIFHLMDDAVIPDPIRNVSIETVLDVAEKHNASIVALCRRVMNFWYRGNGPRSPPPQSMLAHTAVLSTARDVNTTLEFYLASARKSSPSRMVINQGFALWQRDALAWSLAFYGAQADPNKWELGFFNKWTLGQWPGLSRALAVRYLSPDGMGGVEDIAHRGQIKAGISACAWLRAASRLGISPDSIPGGRGFASDPGYSFCSVDGAGGDRRLLLQDLENRCSCSAERCLCGQRELNHSMPYAKSGRL